LTTPVGVTIREENHARFVASCLALRAALRARQGKRQGVLDHVSALLNLGEMWGGWGGPWPGDVVLFALSAVAPAPLEYRERVERLAGQIARRQRKDGAWDGTDPIHAIDVMLSIPSAAAQAAVRAALTQVLSLVRDGELFTDTVVEERSLVALRALVIT
jgi:hypothetical protein